MKRISCEGCSRKSGVVLMVVSGLGLGRDPLWLCRPCVFMRRAAGSTVEPPS